MTSHGHCRPLCKKYFLLAGPIRKVRAFSTKKCSSFRCQIAIGLLWGRLLIGDPPKNGGFPFGFHLKVHRRNRPRALRLWLIRCASLEDHLLLAQLFLAKGPWLNDETSNGYRVSSNSPFSSKSGILNGHHLSIATFEMKSCDFWDMAFNMLCFLIGRIHTQNGFMDINPLLY